MGLFTWLLVPETMGVPIEAVEDRFRQHRFWKHMLAKTDAAQAAAAAAAAAAAGEPGVRGSPYTLEGGERVCKVTTKDGSKKGAGAWDV
jgi:hypothetical protein